MRKGNIDIVLTCALLVASLLFLGLLVGPIRGGSAGMPANYSGIGTTANGTVQNLSWGSQGGASDVANPQPGQWWYNTTTKAFRFRTVAGSLQPSLLLSAGTSDLTTNNSSNPSDLTTTTVKAGSLVAGRVLYFRTTGRVATKAVAPGTLTFSTLFGAATIATGSALTLVGGVSSQPYICETWMACRTAGVSGVSVVAVSARFTVATASLTNLDELLVPANVTTLDTTVDNGLRQSVTFSVADPDNTITEILPLVRFEN